MSKYLLHIKQWKQDTDYSKTIGHVLRFSLIKTIVKILKIESYATFLWSKNSKMTRHGIISLLIIFLKNIII